MVDQSLIKHYHLIKTLVERGAYFFDYGNAFMKAVFDAGAKDIAKNGEDTSEGFIFPSYVEDILGPELFDYGIWTIQMVLSVRKTGRFKKNRPCCYGNY